MKDIHSPSIKDTFTTMKNWLVRYRVTLFIVSGTAVLAFMIFRISQMSTMEPTDAQKTEAKQSVKVVKVNENTVTIIKNLQGNNISIEALFEPGRYDPFND